MAHRAFESFAESLSERRATRRGALAASVAGTLGLAGVAGAAAQDATPEASQDAAQPMFLFVQLAEAGSWAQSADDPEIYELTLAGIGSQTAFFSDRPERIVGTVDTATFLENLGFTPIDPPNAAAVVRTPEGERDVLVVELFDPVLTREVGSRANGVLQYKARVLDAYRGDNLTSWYDEQDDPVLPSTFDQISLFIDDCPDAKSCSIPSYATPPNMNVRAYQGPIPGGPYGTCWNSNDWNCYPCAYAWDYLAAMCNEAYPDCQGYCRAG